MRVRGIPSPMGTEKIRQHRYDTPRAWVKIAEPDVWVTKAAWVWKESGGPAVPPGFVLHHVNGDSLDDRPNNLALILRGTHPQFHADILRERQTGMRYETQTVKCSKCGTEYQGCYQRRDSICRKCRRKQQREWRQAKEAAS